MESFPAYVEHPLVKENTFRGRKPESTRLPEFRHARDLLPEPFWDGHESAITCYWRTWELAFRNLRQPKHYNGFIANYIDTAFNDCLFLWDSVFILFFGRYGSRAFPFQATLDNLYGKQHPDGFICREIREWDGKDQFERHNPVSTGPNVLAWSEWEYFKVSGDQERLARVFPVLVAYHDWLRRYRTWPDGSYWSTGWGCGMDNQPRLPSHCHEAFDHGHMVWSDACFQQILSARLLVEMAGILERRKDVTHLEAEQERLTRFVNDSLWDEDAGFYFDRHADGRLNGVKSVAAFWAILAGAASGSRRERLLAHLDDPREFRRPHRVPTLSADHPQYHPEGQYWKGGVWPPTNYMILRGLSAAGHDDLAHEIGRNHHDNVVDVFEKSGTVFENYAPESASKGNIAREHFVGWGGVGPIAVLFEYVFGLRADVPARRLVWDVRLTERHGVRRYPFGCAGVLDVVCESRASAKEKPRVAVTGEPGLEIEIRWPGGTELVKT